MCLTIPGKIKSIKNGKAVVENGSRSEQIDLGVVIDAAIGDWVLYATDRAVRRIDEVEAREIIELLEDNYQPVDVSALPLEYKKIIYKIRNNSQDTRDQSRRQAGKQIPSINSQNSSVSVIARDEAISTNKDRHAEFTLSQSNGLAMTKEDIEYLLSLRGKNNLEALYSEANVMRKERLEDFVCIHGIIEFSNYCRNNCLYCGIRRDANIRRYRMSEAEIFMAAKKAVDREGYKLIVLQSGEDVSYSDDELIKIIERIKKNLRVFIFISVGERTKTFYKRAFEAGATGSLFRFETSNTKLYRTMHPGHSFRDRLKSLKDQLEIGYYVASGGIIGLPGQTVSDLADDLLLIRELGIPMLSAGPWVPSVNTPLGNPNVEIRNPKQFQNSNLQIPNVIAKNEAISINRKIAAPSEESEWLAMTNDEQLRLTLNYIAAARLLMPEIKIPVTTALETLDPESGRHKGLLAGANALMFNITPEKYRDDYNLYDHKYFEREKVWQKYGLFKGEESYEMLEERLMI